jgi:DNA-directed RNA polymerase subunit M/transcription elongation factor TFIIS
MPTPEQERDRIAGVYAGMSDGELERIARSGDELTDIAQQAFQAELARRDLDLESAKIRSATPEPAAPAPADLRAGDDEVELSQTVTLRRFRDLPQALLAKASLESAGIQAYVIDDNMVRMDWFISNALGGLRLQVHEEDVEAASEILNQPIPEVLQTDGVEEYRQPRCPKCGSLDVSYRELLKSMFTREDVVSWTCGACGNPWEGDSDGIPRATRK